MSVQNMLGLLKKSEYEKFEHLADVERKKGLKVGNYRFIREKRSLNVIVVSDITDQMIYRLQLSEKMDDSAAMDVYADTAGRLNRQLIIIK